MATPQSDGSIVLNTKVVTTGIQKGIAVIKSNVQKASVAITALGVATGYLVKQSVEAYASYEQLVGGVETLFKGSADKVKQYASEAFRTTGMSANEYMQNVTTFSASLISSLGGDTEKAADVANAALVSMSDNVAKFGSSQESVLMAFQGFAKQQYMLLDNLKLGYGGTKTEMERLLRDAEAYRLSVGETVQYEIDNLADVYTAIGDIQEKLGIAETTAKEAATTISGSATMTKAAWQNVLAAISGGGDLDTAIEDFVDSITVLFENLAPVVERALLGVGAMIERIAPRLVQTVANAFIRALPQLMSAVWQMMQGLVQGVKLALIELLTKQSIEVIEQQAEATKEVTQNQEQLTDAVKETNKELKKTLAGFDEIQILSSQSAEETGVGEFLAGAGGATISGDGESDGSAVKQAVNDTFAEIAEKVSGWLMALGCILLVTGNIGWGVSLIIAGALAQEYSEAQIGDGSSLQELIDTLTNALIIGGLVAILIGLLLCVAQMWGIGIKLILIGATSVAAPIAVNWNSIEEKLQGEFGRNLAIVGVIAIILGVLVCIAGAFPVGIGLIVLGAGAVVTPVVVNWDTITNTITSVFMKLSENIWAGLGMVVLGIILCCTGVGVGLGLALILTGASSMVTAVAVNWDAIVGWVEGAWNAVSDFFEKHIAPVLTKEFWLSLAVKCGNGLIAGFEGATNAILQMFETMINRIAEHLNAISIEIPDWVLGIGGKSFGFDIPTVNLGRISIPRLAQGTVVPPNKRFMAMLGDNTVEHEIVSPVSTMKQAFIEAMTEMGGVGQTSREEHYYLNETELMRVIYSLVKGGQHLDGDTLVEE